MTTYLQKHALYNRQIIGDPSDQLGIVVIIPAHDEPELIESLSSLFQCQKPECDVEVIVVINDSEKDHLKVKKSNQRTYEAACNWGREHSNSKLKFHVMYHTNLPAKHAGVGLARKIGMDEAVARLVLANAPRGILCCFDADAKCKRNYLVAIEAYFKNHPKAVACGIRFEHPVSGTEFPNEVYKAIILYELHLRYYVQAQRFAGFPFAFQTIGSSMAVRCDAYQQQGGMNRRKAGEDFYFLHKFVPLGHFQEIRKTCVIPSPRISKRVPFGTGKAVGEIVSDDKLFETYSPRSFEDLKLFFKKVDSFFSANDKVLEQHVKSLPQSIRSFLSLIDYEKNIREIQKNTTSSIAFKNRFYRWFNAFMVMKFVHFARDNFYDNIPVEAAATWLLNIKNDNKFKKNISAKSLLKIFRDLDYKVPAN